MLYFYLVVVARDIDFSDFLVHPWDRTIDLQRGLSGMSMFLVMFFGMER